MDNDDLAEAERIAAEARENIPKAKKARADAMEMLETMGQELDEFPQELQKQYIKSFHKLLRSVLDMRMQKGIAMQELVVYTKDLMFDSTKKFSLAETQHLERESLSIESDKENLRAIQKQLIDLMQSLTIILNEERKLQRDPQKGFVSLYEIQKFILASPLMDVLSDEDKAG